MVDSSFTTYWGNALMGIYVQWENSAVAPYTYTTADLKATFTLNLYAAGVVTEASDATTGNYLRTEDASIYFYMLMLNPIDYFDNAADTTLVHNDWVGFDGVKAQFSTTVAGTGVDTANKWTIATTAGATAASPAAASLFTDIWCANDLSEGQYDAAKCLSDNDLTGLTNAKSTAFATAEQSWTNAEPLDATDYCIEKWAITTATSASALTVAERCVKMQVIGTRKFDTGDNLKDNAGSAVTASSTNTVDIDMTYRKYSITAGWLFNAAGAAATAEPGLVHFDPVDVDFATFINAQVTYTGAMDAFAVAGTSMIAAMIAMSF